MINKIKGVLFHSFQQFCSTLINKTFSQKDTYFNIFSHCHPGWVPWLSAASQSVDNFMGPLLCCGDESAFHFQSSFTFFLQTHISHKKLWLTFWGLSWSSLRATVVSTAVRIPVMFNHCLQSLNLMVLGARAFLSEPPLCRFCLLIVMKLKEPIQS